MAKQNVKRGGRWSGGKASMGPVEPMKSGPSPALSVTVDGEPVKVAVGKIARKVGMTRLVKVNEKFDEVFRSDPDFYVGPAGSGGIGTRYEMFKDFLKTGKTVDASEVSVSPDGRVGFTNGRHRYAVMRDGMPTVSVPVAMSPDSVRYAEKFGYLSK